MKDTNVPKWIEETLFQCDVTKESYNYKDLNVVWYDRLDKENSKAIIEYDLFMLVKQGEGFLQIKNSFDEWSLSSRSLEEVVNENVILFFTDFLDVDSIHDKGDLKKVTNLNSWTELLRRLSVPYYGTARHRIKEAKEMDYFCELTELQLLQPENLSKFVNSF